MGDSIHSVAGFYTTISNYHSLDSELYLKLGNITIKTRSNSKELIEALEEYFDGFLTSRKKSDIEILAIENDMIKPENDLTVKTPDPGKTKIKEEYADLSDGRIVRKVLTGMLFVFNGTENTAIGPCLKNSNQVINFINNRYIELLLKRNCLLFHAAGIHDDSNGICFSGFSGSGKSTLALHMMREGFSFLSNDRIMVEKKADLLFMHGIPKLPRINPGTILNNPALYSIITNDDRQEFEKLSENDLWKLEHKYDASINEIFGEGRFKLFSEMNRLVILSWERNNSPMTLNKVDLSDRPDLFPAFMKAPGLFFKADEEFRGTMQPQSAYSDFLKNCDTYELSGGVDFEGAVKALLKILK